MKVTIEYEIGDKVKLPSGQTDTLVGIKNIIWGHKYRVKIRKSNKHFDYKTNQIVDYKFEDLSPE